MTRPGLGAALSAVDVRERGRVRFVDEPAPSVDPMQRIWDRVSMVGELPRRLRDGHLVPVERPLGTTGATVFLTSDGTIYERRANGVIRRVKKP